MQVNKFITMAVGLIVGVLLIAGVVAPVIANVSDTDDSGGSAISEEDIGPEFQRYSKVTNSTNVSIWPYYDNSNSKYGYSYQDPAEHPESVIYSQEAQIYCDDCFIGMDASGGAGNLSAKWVVALSEEYHTTGPVVIQNGTISVSGWDVSLGNPLFYPDPEGEYVSFRSLEEETYLDTSISESTEIFSMIMTVDSTTYETGYISASGSVSNNTISTQMEIAHGNSVTFTLDDGMVTGVGLSFDSEDVDLLKDDGFMAATAGYDFQLADVLVPIGSGGSGSGISPTLITILSIIPLILTIGLVIGAIGYLRFKE